MTAAALERTREKIDKDRERRIHAHRRAIARRMRQPLAARLLAPLNILAEGDSWFDYPLARDIIGFLGARGTPRPDILDLAHRGDATTEMLGVSQRERIRENLGDPQNGTFDALLFSGGGNDIAGDQFVLWLKSRTNGAVPADGVHLERLAAIVGIVRAAYADLIAIRDEIRPDCIVFLHSYDFAQPSGDGVCGYGPWLKPSLDFRGWTNFDEAALIIRDILQSLDQMLEEFERDHANVVYVRTQGTLDPNSDWDNELHPNRAGFDKLGGVFLNALRLRFPGRI